MRVKTNKKGKRRMVMKQPIKNVVLVHGAFADGSGWAAVANILKNDGYTVSVVQHPETSYAEDQKYTKAAIDAMDGPVVLVGHSYGGSVIT
jgi:pimeloyl-ACP methyl ester carboxylesterase